MAPIPVQRAHPLPHQHASTLGLYPHWYGGNDTDSDGSGAETKKEWLDESELTEIAPLLSSPMFWMRYATNFVFIFLTSDS